MSDEPITAQGEALRLWPDEGVPLMPGYRGYQHVSIGYRSVRMRVWERLLDRNDICVVDDPPHPKRAPSKTLYITRQGRERAAVLAARGAFTIPGVVR